MVFLFMILIISKIIDYSTQDVINWLEYRAIEYIRLNKEDKVNLSYIGDDVIFRFASNSFKLSQISSVWFRRGYINDNLLSDKEYMNTNYSDFITFLELEEEHLKQYLYFQLSKKKHLNTFSTNYINKLIVSDVAKDIGLKIPKTYLINNKKSFDNLKDQGKLITKTIYGNPVITINGEREFMYTTVIDKIEDDEFFPSIFQEYIDKKYELRVFYIDGDFYSMAIFSQNDATTKVDFRDYNYEKPNRTVPFKLPSIIEDKLKVLMEKINLNCGSIDIIVTKNNDYVFLEVNPVGQFGMVSYPCNYNLEEKIAKYLTVK